MSLADACLVCMAEQHPDCRVLTLDADFTRYRRGRLTIPTVMPPRTTPHASWPHRAAISTMRFAYSSTVATAPGGSTDVDSRSSTIAGPAIESPAAIL